MNFVPGKRRKTAPQPIPNRDSTMREVCHLVREYENGVLPSRDAVNAIYLAIDTLLRAELGRGE